jgi:EmrB/QacA subfamily drug resistance transporter
MSGLSEPMASASVLHRKGDGRRALARRPSVALAALCGLLLLTFLDNTVVSVLLGSVQADTHAGVTQLQWVVNAYALVFASVMVAAGALADRVGRKKVMLTGAAVFCAGSFACALAPSPAALVAARAVMGLGAAGSEPGTLSIIRQIYADPRARARAIGVWSAVAAFALALGPVLGGTLSGLAGWRSVFWFNLALGAVVLLVAQITVPESRDPQAHRVDLVGAALGASALAATVYGIIRSENSGFGAAPVVVSFIVAAATAAGFAWWQRHTAHPLLPPELRRNRVFVTSNFVAGAVYFGTFAIFFFTALYLQVVAGRTDYDLAAIFAPMTVAMIGASLLAGRLATDAVVRRRLVVAGCLIFAAGLALTDVLLRPTPPDVALAVALAVAGLGIGLTVVPVTAAALEAAPAGRAGLAASVTNTSRQIGAVLGVAVLGALVNARLTEQLTTSLRRLGIPANFQQIVISAVKTGGLPSSGQGTGAAGGPNAGLVQRVIDAAYDAFHAGLHEALLLAAGLAIASAVAAAFGMRAGHDESASPASVRQ